MTIVAVVSEAGGRYCEESLSPAFSHVWVCDGKKNPLLPIYLG